MKLHLEQTSWKHCIEYRNSFTFIDNRAQEQNNVVEPVQTDLGEELTIVLKDVFDNRQKAVIEMQRQMPLNILQSLAFSKPGK